VRLPSALVLDCPNCGEKPHRIVKGKISDGKEIVLDGLVRCTGCGQTRRERIQEPRPLSVPIVVSEGGSSVKKTIEIDPRLVVKKGDRFLFEGGQIEISGIEQDGRRPEEALSTDIDTLWAKRMDKVVVRISISRAGRTITKEVEASPDEEFFTGDMVEFGRTRAVIHRIKVKNRLIRDGKARAEDIVRIYATPVRKRYA
jgi:uncharacterized Zn finger protein